jgi:sporulation protein YlmC with PRC-barrel domain
MRATFLIATVLSPLLLAASSLAQQATTGAQPATPTNAESATPPENAAPPPGGRSDLVVATVKLKQGWRASKLIGSDVFNDKNQKIGNIDDLIVMPNDQISYAIISVGGFLGLGNKRVAIPYQQLKFLPTKDGGPRIELTGATKATLEAMPGFTFNPNG